MRRVTPARTASVLAFLLAVPLGHAAPAARSDDERVIDRTLSAENVRELVVRGQKGTIRITGRSDEKVVLHLKLEAKEREGFFGKRRGDPYAVELVTETTGDRLRLDLSPDDEREGLEETWDLEVPSRLAAWADLVVGKIDVRDVAGGLDLHMSVGDIELDVPRGNIRARTNVGNIRATTGTSSYGDVDLRSNVGDTHLELSGHTVKYDKPPGAGNHISLNGSGQDRIDLRVNVGDASLRIQSAS